MGRVKLVPFGSSWAICEMVMLSQKKHFTQVVIILHLHPQKKKKYIYIYIYSKNAIFGKGKYFQMFNCIMKIFLENIFMCLVTF